MFADVQVVVGAHIDWASWPPAVGDWLHAVDRVGRVDEYPLGRLPKADERASSSAPALMMKFVPPLGGVGVGRALGVR